MSYYTPEQLTGLMQVQFSGIFYPFDNATFFAPKDDTLGIKFMNPAHSLFRNERTAFGRALRLLWFIHGKKSLLTVFAVYNLKTVLFTEAFSPAEATKHDTAILTTEFLSSVLRNLQKLSEYGPDQVEQGIVNLIAENRGRYSVQ